MVCVAVERRDNEMAPVEASQILRSVRDKLAGAFGGRASTRKSRAFQFT
jgi:hypothetical protein